MLLTALVIVALIMLIVYRSPLLWLLPLLGAIGAIVLAQACAHGLANAGLTVSTLSADILIVLVFGAAARLCPATHPPVQGRTVPSCRPRGRDGGLTTRHAAYFGRIGGHGHLRDDLPASGRLGVPARAGPGWCRRYRRRLPGPGHLPAFVVARHRAPGILAARSRDGAAGREGSRVWSGIGARVDRAAVATALAALVLLGASCAGLATVRIGNDPVDNVKGHAGSIASANCSPGTIRQVRSRR